MLNVVLGVACLALGIVISVYPTSIWAYWALVVVASVLGVLLTIPIGGADMPVAIALLNSYYGLAGAATGFVLNNTVLIIAGSLVGASGIILTQIMCKAMNRSLINVLTGAIGPDVAGGAKADDVYAGRVKSATAEDVAMLFDNASRVVMVPGYGLAVSQAQHQLRDLAVLLESKGIEVEYAIHPVAGRMPGHMNVLLAEADVPYDKLKEMDEINPTFEQTDVVLVIGANDVVNPLARTDPSSRSAGMPILDADKARTYRAMWTALNKIAYWQGEIVDRRKDNTLYPTWLSISLMRDAAGNATHYISSFTDITERKQAEAQISQLAYYDTLTGLLNRFSLRSQLEQVLAMARRDQHALAVIFLDLDRFKSINDTLGHAIGDELLIAVAKRLRESVRDSDIVARPVGDEFVVVLTEVEVATAVARLAYKILNNT